MLGGPVIKMRLILKQKFLSARIKQEISRFVVLGWETGFTSCNESKACSNSVSWRVCVPKGIG
jgi:hypothetical protein